MTAGTLSTLKCVPLTVHTLSDHGRGVFAAGVAQWIDDPPRRPVRLWPPPHARDDARPRRRPDADAIEHQARGLLNLIALASRCAATAGAGDDQRRAWRLEIDDANQRLEALYRAGLSRNFMTDKPGAAAR